ncbi:MAG: SET domain-containing protein-lysine N-methyltransferase [Thermoguttaceae bacterium]|nr:SET domain-containing protein-lysine N-methyltransferase [Thermoguttaceae bacterium]
MGYRDGAIEPDAPYRYINHSCDPNCELIEWEIDGGEGEKYYELWLHAKRAVGIGEELTIDYAANGAVRTESSAVCLCGSPDCRGFI